MKGSPTVTAKASHKNRLSITLTPTKRLRYTRAFTDLRACVFLLICLLRILSPLVSKYSIVDAKTQEFERKGWWWKASWRSPPPALSFCTQCNPDPYSTAQTNLCYTFCRHLLYQEEAYLLQNFLKNAHIKQKQIQHTLPMLSLAHITKGKTSARLMLLLLALAVLMLSSCAQAPASTGSTTTKSTGPTLTYVAIGASDTFGIGAQNPYTQNWASDLNSFLGSQSHLINLGVPGMTLHVALSAELPVAIDSHPNLITIWLAVNDLATNVPVESYSKDLDTLLTRLQQAAPQARIEVGNVPDLTRVPFFHSYDQAVLSQQIEIYNTAIASSVARHHVILVDLSGQGYNLQTAPEFISSDGLHPSTLGYQQVARLFYNALEKAGYPRTEA